MERFAALPFFLTRGQDEMSATTVTTRRETVHGLLRLQGNALTIQWRLATKTERMGSGIQKDHAVGSVEEIVVPVPRMGGATVRRGWWSWPPGPRLALTAANLTALEELAGADGLSLDHPAELVVRIRRSDRLAEEEFCAELALAISEAQLPPTENVLPENRKPMLGQARIERAPPAAE
jgi:hypothetical protein